MTGKLTRVRINRELAEEAMRALGVMSRTEALSKLAPRFNVGRATRSTMAVLKRRCKRHGPHVHRQLHSLHLQYQGTDAAHSRGSPASALRLLQRHSKRRRPGTGSGRWHSRPYSPSPLLAGEYSPGHCDAEAQGELIALDGAGIQLATGVRRVQCESVPDASSEGLHREARRAPPPAELRGRIYPTAAELRDCLRSAVRLWMRHCMQRNLRRPYATAVGLDGMLSPR